MTDQAMEIMMVVESDGDIDQKSIISDLTSVSISQTSRAVGLLELPCPSTVGLSPDTRAVTVYTPCNEERFSSKYEILIRKQVEYFETDHAHVAAGVGYGADGKLIPLVLGQVGLRCLHCRNIPDTLRTSGAVLFPSRLSEIKEGCLNMAAMHLTECPLVPSNVRQDLLSLRHKTFTPLVLPEMCTGLDVWVAAAQLLHVYENLADNLLRFDPEWDGTNNYLKNYTPLMLMQRSEELTIQSLRHLIEHLSDEVQQKREYQ